MFFSILLLGMEKIIKKMNVSSSLLLTYQALESREGIASQKNLAVIKDLSILDSQNNIWTNSSIGVQGDYAWISFSSLSKLFWCYGYMFLTCGKFFFIYNLLFGVI